MFNSPVRLEEAKAFVEFHKGPSYHLLRTLQPFTVDMLPLAVLLLRTPHHVLPQRRRQRRDSSPRRRRRDIYPRPPLGRRHRRRTLLHGRFRPRRLLLYGSALRCRYTYINVLL